jgi:syntaxin-binding protein 5
MLRIVEHRYTLLLAQWNVQVAQHGIGFIGVGYIDGSVAVIDLRGPSLLRLQHQKRQSNFLVRHQDADPVVSLTWTVAAVSMGTYWYDMM